MPLTVVNSKGMTLKAGDGASPEVFTAIGGIVNMPDITFGKSVKDRTALSDSIRYYGHGIEEPPSITVEYFWNPDDTQQNAIVTAYENETSNNYRIDCPDSPATTYTFKAIVTGYSLPKGGIDEDLMASATFQLIINDGSAVVTKA